MTIRRERPVTESALSPPPDSGSRDPVRKGDDFDAMFGQFQKVLRRVASRSLKSNGCRSTQTTALLHDAWMKLESKRDSIVDERHLIALATRILGHLAVDHHRAAVRRKNRLEVASRSAIEVETKPEDAKDTFTVLERLFGEIAEHSPRAATVAKLKLFRGLSLQEIAVALGTSKRTVSYDWKFARAMLASELRPR